MVNHANTDESCLFVTDNVWMVAYPGLFLIRCLYHHVSSLQYMLQNLRAVVSCRRQCEVVPDERPLMTARCLLPSIFHYTDGDVVATIMPAVLQEILCSGVRDQSCQIVSRHPVFPVLTGCVFETERQRRARWPSQLKSSASSPRPAHQTPPPYTPPQSQPAPPDPSP